MLTAPQVLSVDAKSPDLKTVLAASGVALKDVPAKLVYVPTADGLQLSWRLSIQTIDKAHWYDAFVAADTGKPLLVDDLVDHASYRVFASPVESPDDGVRTLVTDTHDLTASPFGWHDTNGIAGAEFTDTRGNNAIVQEDTDNNDTGGFRPDGAVGLNFNFPLDLSQAPATYQAASITNVFYLVNTLHDIHYHYGFTEAAGNFQSNNYGKGGVANDPVIVDVQNGVGIGPSFFTPPDGTGPRMTLSIGSASGRDSGLDSGIVIHEFGHGVAERLTGGPANDKALNGRQSKGMNEGWADWWAIMLMQRSTDAKLGGYTVGSYFSNLAAGGRRFPYSFDKIVNPLTYGDYNNASTYASTHKTGEIWASALWDMNWLLIDKYGFSSDFYHGTGGNNTALQLVMDGLKLQGTNPSLLEGRDAILAADLAVSGGQNHAEIWAAFARRGLGFSASDGSGSNSTAVTEAFDIPGTISGSVFRDDDADGVRDAGEPGLPGWTVFRDLNNNGVQDFATTTIRNSTDTPKATVSPFMTSSLVVAGLSGTVVDLNITVNITHQATGELVLTLIAPNSAVTPITLAQYLGGSGDNYTNTTFDDEALVPITSGSAPFTGSFRSFSSMSQADGISPNGTWILRIDDLSGGFSGMLVSWSMSISHGSPDPTIVSDADGNYTFFNTDNGTHHIRDIVQPGFTQTAPVSGVLDVVIAGGVPVVGQNFGARSIATASGTTTFEDTLSAALPITAPAGLGATHFKISGINGGALFKSNGVTPINDGSFVTIAEGLAGAKFLPSANSNAAGSFTVELSQNGTTVVTGTTPATSTITVTPVGDTPQVANITTLEDALSGAIVITPHAADASEVTHFKITGVTGGMLFKNNGATQINNGDFITIDDGQSGVKFLPSANSTTAGSFDVESSQNGSAVAAQSGKATSEITVNAVNDVPTANGQSVTLEEDTFKTITLTGSDVDGDSLTFVVVAQPLKGTLSGVLPNLIYTPNANYNGSDSFSFKVNDGTIDSAMATIAITVNAVNDAPMANGQSVTLDEDTSKSITLTGADIDGDSLTFIIVAQPLKGTLSGALPNLTYTPNANYNGADSFTFKANDGTIDSALATVAVTVNAANDAPTANGQAVTLEEDTFKTITLAGSDIEGDSLTFVIVAQPLKGTLSGALPNLTYTPNANYNGSDSFTFKVNDGTIDSATSTIAITVNAVNDAPTASGQSVTLDEDTSKAITLAGSDIEGDSLTFIIVAQPLKGTLSGALPNLTYTPNANYNGADSFTFKANDGTIDSALATVAVTVNAANDAPTANGQAVTLEEDTFKTITLAGSDIDGDSLAFTIVAQPLKGTLSGVLPNLIYTPNANYNGSDSFTFKANDGTIDSATSTIAITVNAVNDAPTASGQSVTLDEDTSKAITLAGSDIEGDNLTFTIVAQPLKGSLAGTVPNLTYTPNANYNGSDSFTFKANDGTVDSAPATIAITVNAVNDAPTANGQSVTLEEDTFKTITLAGSDIDGDSLTFVIVAQPLKGTLSGTLPNLTYTPNANYNGSDSFTFKANDGTVDSAPATIAITVNAVNDAPTANGQSVTLDEDTFKTITLTGNDIDGDSLAFTIVAQPLKGTLSGVLPNLIYTPNANYNGSDSFTFKVNDGTIDSAPATIAITVNAVNDTPMANGQSVTL